MVEVLPNFFQRPHVPGKRTFLFLQGLASPFMFRLARLLREGGHRILRVHLTGADPLFWPAFAINFRGHPVQWESFIAEKFSRHGVTDLVLFGDRRPYHRTALEVGRRMGIAAHIFEEGYLRPNWITLEHRGTNGASVIPRDPDMIRKIASRIPNGPPVVPLTGSFFNRATWEVAANVLGLALTPMFPHFERHRLHHPILEFAGWLRRFARAPIEYLRTQRTVRDFVEAEKTFYFVPLQLHSDYQIRVYSPYQHPLEAVAEIITSFCAYAPKDAILLFKLHPLDPGLIDYRGRIAAISRDAGVDERVALIGDYDLTALLNRSRGVIVINSTVGMLALEHGRMVKALGIAIYDMPGLTFQGSLDEFWNARMKPDPALLAAYRRVVLGLTQLNGGMFTWQAIELGTRNAMQRIIGDGSALTVGCYPLGGEPEPNSAAR